MKELLSGPAVPMADDLEFVRQTLIGVHERSIARLWGEEIPESTRDWRPVFERYCPFGDARWLETRLPSLDHRPRGRLLEGNRLVFLDLVGKEKALPILDLRWDLTRTPVEEVRFRFFLLSWEPGEKRPRAIGFRLESPEGSGVTKTGPGIHDYWHCQMITELEKDDQEIQKLIDKDVARWIPTDQPAFPLPAKNMGDLLAVLLLSLYGIRQLAELRGTIGFADLAQRFNRMGIALT